MSEKERRSGRVEITIPIRVRGMSTETKFFDEQAGTKLVSKHGVMAHLRNLPDLETEVHVTNLQNNMGGTFRVAWINTQSRDGLYDVGLEEIETEGDLWNIYFPPGQTAEAAETAQAWLKCQRCLQKQLTPVPETEAEFLYVGFRVARPCDRCKATTAWEFASSDAREASLTESAGVGVGSQENLRTRGRVPLAMKIKVIRRVYGTIVEDVCQTENISRNGAYFLTRQNYDIGESVEVIVPYKEGDVAIAVPASVVRRDENRGNFLHGVAVRMEQGKK